MRTLILPATALVLAIFLPGRIASAGEDPSGTQSPDVVITSELAEESQVLILKDRKTADSLFHLREPAIRTEFVRFVQDTAVSVEVRTKAEFRKHWDKLERREGFREMRAQYASTDPDHSRIPRANLFDSSVVVFPGWVILRRGPNR